MKFAEAFVEIAASLNSGSFSAVKNQITQSIGRAGEEASSKLSSALSGVGGVVAKISAAVGAVGLAKWGLSLAAEAEQAQVAFEVLLGSADKAKRVLADLNKFAAETPFETPELTAAAKQLAAFGVSAAEIVPTLRRLGDISSGIGAPIGEIAYLYGTARTQGRLYAADVMQFTGRGIPLIAALAKQFGVSEGEVKKLVETGKVGFPQLVEAIRSMTDEGGQFAGMMEKQSQTLAGVWSTFADTMKGKLREAAEVAIAAFDLKSLITDTTEAADKMGILAQAVATVADVVDAIGDGFKYAQAGIVQMIATVMSKVAELLEWMQSIPGVGKSFFEMEDDPIADTFADAAAWAREFAKAQQEAADVRWDGWRQAFEAKTPSERVQAVRDAMKATKEATDEAAGSMATFGTAASKAAEDAKKIIASLKEELDTFGMSSREKQIAKLAKGDDPFAVDEAEKIDKQLRDKETATRVRTKAEGEIERIRESTRTPEEKYKADLSHLKTLKDVYGMDDKTYKRQVAKVTEDTASDMVAADAKKAGKKPSTGDAQLMGLDELFFSNLVAVNSGGDTEKDELKKLNEKTAELLELQKKYFGVKGKGGSRAG